MKSGEEVSGWMHNTTFDLRSFLSSFDDVVVVVFVAISTRIFDHSTVLRDKLASMLSVIVHKRFVLLCLLSSAKRYI
jgi:hypothetical protein